MCYLPHRGRCGSHQPQRAGPLRTGLAARCAVGMTGAHWRLVEAQPGRRRLIRRLGRRRLARSASAGWCRSDGRGGRRPQLPPDGSPRTGRSVRTAPVPVGGHRRPRRSPGTLRQHYTDRGLLADARALQHERYGGAKLGSAIPGLARRRRPHRVPRRSVPRCPRGRSAGPPATGKRLYSPCCSIAYYTGGTNRGRAGRFACAPATASCRGWSVSSPPSPTADRRVRRRAVRRVRGVLAADPAHEPPPT